MAMALIDSLRERMKSTNASQISFPIPRKIA
jgi:hypothetical protein